MVGCSAGANILAQYMVERGETPVGVGVFLSGEYDLWELYQEGKLKDSIKAYVGSDKRRHQSIKSTFEF